MTVLFLMMSNACSSKKDEILEDSVEAIDEIIDDTDEFVDNVEDDFFDGDDLFEDPEGYEETEYVSGDEAIDADFTSDSDDEFISPTPSNPSRSYTSSSTGDYMVIAGNYLVESNARSMTRKLSNLGYPNAEIGVFERSQYHTVIAYRHGSYSSALEMSNAIKRQGIDCYVKKRQY